MRRIAVAGSVTPQMTITFDPRGIAGWRRSLGLTQAELAKRVGTHAETVSILERALMPGEVLDSMIEKLQEAQAARAA